MNEINKKKLNQFFDAVADLWKNDLNIIHCESSEGKYIDQFLRNRISATTPKFIKAIWKDYME